MCDEKKLEFNIIPSTVKFNKISYPLDKRCNAVTIINQGTSNVTINSMIRLIPTASISFGGNRNEVMRGSIDIAFDSTIVANNQCIVIQKVYL